MTYFKPLQRKFGLLTIALTCAMAVLWWRSNTKFDSLSFKVGSEHHRLSSSKNYGLAWETWVWSGDNVTYIRDGQRPHIWIIAPMAVLSAGLLLSKPKP